MIRIQWGNPAPHGATNQVRQINQVQAIDLAMLEHFGLEYRYSTKTNFYHDISIVLNGLGAVISQIEEDFEVSQQIARRVVGFLCIEWYQKTIKREADKFERKLKMKSSWGTAQ